MKANELVAAYIKARDKEAKLKAEFDAKIAPIKELREKIEAQLLKLMHEMGVESLRTDAGTAYRSVRTSCSVADWDVFFRFVQEKDAYHMLEHRASKTAVEQYLNEHQELPPGLNWSETQVVNFRRS